MLDKGRSSPGKLRFVLGAGSHLGLLVLRLHLGNVGGSAEWFIQHVLNLQSQAINPRHFQAGNCEPYTLNQLMEWRYYGTMASRAVHAEKYCWTCQAEWSSTAPCVKRGAGQTRNWGQGYRLQVWLVVAGYALSSRGASTMPQSDLAFSTLDIQWTERRLPKQTLNQHWFDSQTVLDRALFSRLRRFGWLSHQMVVDALCSGRFPRVQEISQTSGRQVDLEVRGAMGCGSERTPTYLLGTWKCMTALHPSRFALRCDDCHRGQSIAKAAIDACPERAEAGRLPPHGLCCSSRFWGLQCLRQGPRIRTCSKLQMHVDNIPHEPATDTVREFFSRSSLDVTLSCDYLAYTVQVETLLCCRRSEEHAASATSENAWKELLGVRVT